MNRPRYRQILSFVCAVATYAILAVLLPLGCSTEKSSPTLPGAHPDSWMDPGSPDFHGNLAVRNGVASCSECHGINTPGGEVGISCLDCHGPGTSNCISCHGGTDNSSGAPPLGLRGEEDDTTLAVGAHTAHLVTSTLAAAAPCSTCHIVPTFVFSPGHIDPDSPDGEYPDSIAEIVWHGIADPGNALWNRLDRTCANTYCHGNFSGGFADNIPVWTADNQAGCGSCHDVGSDPAQLGWKHRFHVSTAGLGCVECHYSVVDSLYTIIEPALHVNGTAEVVIRDNDVCAACHGPGAQSCVACHGGNDNQTGAPPVGLEGETTTDQLAVGAHTIHVTGGSQADAFDCSECHIVPDSLTAPDHIGADEVAELTWGALAGPAAAWTRGSATCAGTYCHGNFAGGKSANEPVWTGTNQAGCGSCHDVGSNPDELGWIHPYHINTAGLACGDCHASVVDMSWNIVNTALHVNGQTDLLTRDQATCDRCHGTGPEVCVQCHGGTDNQTGAPPVGLEGETTTDQLAVGAHTRHLEGGAQADAFDCSECHKVPSTLLEIGHLGLDEIAELTYGPLAGAASTWNRSTGICSNTYCHGNFAGGDKTNSPQWTGTSQAGCGSCHDVGSSPSQLGGNHAYHINSAGLACGDCHASVVDMSLNIVNTALHVNGAVELLTRDQVLCDQCHDGTESCVQCHGGTDNLTGAPPVGLEGETATSQLAVGAHTTHMEGGSQADAFDCADCHVVPAAVADPGHLDGDDIAEIAWSSLAGASSTWNRSTGTCSNTYCHGEFNGGDQGNNPQWTGNNQAGCGSCHDVGSSPGSLSGEHSRHVNSEGLSCAECHSTVVNGSLTITGPALHVNGTDNVSFLRGGQYSGGSCSGLNNNACHGSENW
jgi:predicted CxxxxCH...CXXCH cytochrome family protein